MFEQREHSTSKDNAAANSGASGHGVFEIQDVFRSRPSGSTYEPEKQAAVGPAGSQARPQRPEQPACPASPEFNEYIDGIARKIYDPMQLGDLDTLKNKYNCQIERTKNPAGAVKQFLDSDDDPWTNMMDKAEYKTFKESRKGNVVEVGIHLRTPTYLEEKSPFKPPILVQDFEPISTARDAGIMRGDQILEINGVSMAQKTERHAAVMLAGEENTSLKIKVWRDGQPLEFTIDRKRVESPAITVDKLNNGDVVRIRVHSFVQDDTSDEIARAVKDNSQAKGFILDLRHNGGGFVDQAAKSASVFIKEGKLMTMRSRIESDPANPRYENDVFTITAGGIAHKVDGKEPRPYRDRHPDLTDKPMVVLIDQGTASASEIVAGALKDTDGAYLIGTATYGKGIGQTIFPDDKTGGAIKLTNFAYYTPSNRWVGDGHEKRYGLIPDKTVANPRPADFGTAQDGQINAALEYLQSKFPKEEPLKSAPAERVPLPPSRSDKSRASDLLERLNRKPRF